MITVAFVAALEREVAPLIRHWKSRHATHDSRPHKIFENENAALICAGIGREPARRAAEAIIAEYHPSSIISVGFAGALDSNLGIGDVFTPTLVIDASDGAKTNAGGSSGTLLSFGSVAGREQKQKLRQAYGAAAVDMEAGAVAQAAHVHGIQFSAIKVVSDEAEFELPPMEEFIAPDGRFRAAAFSLHVAVRPWLWPATIVLASNSARASRSLCRAIEQHLNTQPSAPSLRHD